MGTDENGDHECDGDLPAEGDGPAITCCFGSEDGTLWVGRGAFQSQVAFCPYCGFQASVIPTVLLLKRLDLKEN